MSVSDVVGSCLRNRSSAWYLCISPLHRAFRRRPTDSSTPVSTAVRGWAPQFDRWLDAPPAHPLNPINPDNARILRITAAAGTELADAYSPGTLIGRRTALIAPRQKRFTTHRAFLPHAAWLVQSSLHWPIFLTAASRRSLVRVSVPVWGISLSAPLGIDGLVGRCPANYLMPRMPVHGRRIFQHTSMRMCVLRGISPDFSGLSPSHG